MAGVGQPDIVGSFKGSGYIYGFRLYKHKIRRNCYLSYNGNYNVYNIPTAFKKRGKSKNSNNILRYRLTDERFNHIIKNYPELNGKENNIIEMIENPDIIFEDNFNELLAVKFYDKTPMSENEYLVVIYKETENDDGLY